MSGCPLLDQVRRHASKWQDVHRFSAGHILSAQRFRFVGGSASTHLKADYVRWHVTLKRRPLALEGEH